MSSTAEYAFRRDSRRNTALTDNGGTLLVNGVPDPDWARRTMRLVQESSRGLERCRSVMEQDPGRNFEIRMVDGMFLFTKSTEPESMLRRLNEVSGAEVSASRRGRRSMRFRRVCARGRR